MLNSVPRHVSLAHDLWFGKEVALKERIACLDRLAKVVVGLHLFAQQADFAAAEVMTKCSALFGTTS